MSNPRDAHSGCPIFSHFVIVGEKCHSEPTPIRGPLLEICRNIIGLERIPTLKPPPWRSSYLGGPTGSDIVNTYIGRLTVTCAISYLKSSAFSRAVVCGCISVMPGRAYVLSPRDAGRVLACSTAPRISEGCRRRGLMVITLVPT